MRDLPAETMDSPLRGFPPNRCAVPRGEAQDNPTGCPALPHRSAAAHSFNGLDDQGRDGALPHHSGLQCQERIANKASPE